LPVKLRTTCSSLKMKHKIWFFACILLVNCGCASIKLDKVKYNTAKRQYEYVKGKVSIPLRNNQQQLIDSTNIDAFRTELLENGLKYSFREKAENDELLLNTDFKLAQLYSGINAALQDHAWKQAIEKIDSIRHINTSMDYYSDCAFLEGYAYERMGERDRAVKAYRIFCTYSEKKYSKRFRGHLYDDLNDAGYIVERNHAYHFLHQKPDSISEAFQAKPITPKCYYKSNQPGFIYNPQDYGPHTRFVMNLGLGFDLSDALQVGFTVSWMSNPHINLNAGVYFSPGMSEYIFSAPIQLYKSESNQIGVKLTPFMKVHDINNLTIKGSILSNQTVYDYGAKISTSLLLSQKVYLGSYYQYNHFNQKRPYQPENNSVLIWCNNEYDISCYYHTIKGLSLKVGVKNTDLVAGFRLGNTEFSYNITSPGIILRGGLF